MYRVFDSESVTTNPANIWSTKRCWNINEGLRSRSGRFAADLFTCLRADSMEEIQFNRGKRWNKGPRQNLARNLCCDATSVLIDAFWHFPWIPSSHRYAHESVYYWKTTLSVYRFTFNQFSECRYTKYTECIKLRKLIKFGYLFDERTYIMRIRSNKFSNCLLSLRMLCCNRLTNSLTTAWSMSCDILQTLAKEFFFFQFATSHF